MSGPKPLDHAGANAQVEEIKRFMLQQAREEADDIERKTEEDYQTEKARLKEDAERVIKADYMRKEKRVQSESKIGGAKDINSARLRMLQRQADTMASVLEEATSQVSAVTQTGEYKALLVGLIEQGLARPLEPSAVIRCLERDVASVEAAIPDAVAQFLKLHGKPGAKCDVVIDKQHFLKGMHPDGLEYAGGVIVMSNRGHVWVDNTFNSRLSIASEVCLPGLKQQLFGPHMVLSSKINTD